MNTCLNSIRTERLNPIHDMCEIVELENQLTMWNLMRPGGC